MAQRGIGRTRRYVLAANLEALTKPIRVKSLPLLEALPMGPRARKANHRLGGARTVSGQLTAPSGLSPFLGPCTSPPALKLLLPGGRSEQTTGKVSDKTPERPVPEKFPLGPHHDAPPNSISQRQRKTPARCLRGCLVSFSSSLLDFVFGIEKKYTSASPPSNLSLGSFTAPPSTRWPPLPPAPSTPRAMLVSTASRLRSSASS